MRRTAAYRLFGALKDIWTDFGEPMPWLVRGIRHRLLGRLWPAESIVVGPAISADVAVVIPCHNYGKFLADAIESVLDQTLPAKEILVVDDASTDDTAEIAAMYAPKGVRYLRGAWRSVGAARNAGLDATTAPLLVFLDADDLLHDQYLRQGAAVLAADPAAGFAYPNQTHFGTRRMVYEAPAQFDWRRFDMQNHCSVSSMVRRGALVQAGGFSHGVGHDGDWITWRRILALGWTAVKLPGTLFCRNHGTNMTDALARERSYAQRAGFFEEPATLFLALSGRAWMWPKTADFLERQTFPHDRMHLVILDTSQNAAFARTIRDWLRQCDYRSTTFLCETVGPAGIADRDRSDPATLRTMSDVCAGIYNRFARRCTTTLACVLEDDVLPPVDAFPRLIERFDVNIASVSGLYYHRLSPDPVAWEWHEHTGGPIFATPKAGVTPVGGNGFGCVVLRGERLRRTVFHAGKPHENYDHNFYKTIAEDGEIALIDWDLRCEHCSRP